MSFDWSEYLDLARELAKFSEAGQRSAISRAYYAAFCTARYRKQADYEDTVAGLPQTATTALMWAEQVLSQAGGTGVERKPRAMQPRPQKA